MIVRFTLIFVSVFCVYSSAFAEAGFPAPSVGLRPLALVYAGSGVCKEQCANSAARVARLAGFRVHYVTADNWQESDFKNARVYLQPGGHSAEVAATLSHEQKARLRQFVADGGSYVGFCAGAFFASEKVQDTDGSYFPEERLALIPMTSQLFSVDTNDAAILPVLWNGVLRNVYWEGGPYFQTPVAPGVEVIATYADGSIASLRTHYGNGRVFVTGYHPEAPQSWRDSYKLADPDGLDTDEAVEMVKWAAGL